MPWQHLLLPIDWNEAHERAIEAALEVAAQHQAATTLMYVIEAIDDDDEDDLQAFYDHVAEQVRERLQVVIRRFEQAGLSVRPEIVVGHRARTIVQYSASETVDLVVMPSERVDLSRPEAALDSQSHVISTLCQCPVMLIR